MATRRQPAAVSTSAADDTFSQADASTSEKSDTSLAVSTSTVLKLAVFTLGMFTLPLAAYFSSQRLLFPGNSTYAGALAALVANLVLVAYVIAAVWEDQGDRAEDERERDKRAERRGKGKEKAGKGE